jgi:hypothetical protein
VKGVDDLNQRLGIFDDRQTQAIKLPASSSNMLAAQRMMLDGVSSSTQAAEAGASGWTAA